MDLRFTLPDVQGCLDDVVPLAAGRLAIEAMRPGFLRMRMTCSIPPGARP